MSSYNIMKTTAAARHRVKSNDWKVGKGDISVQAKNGTEIDKPLRVKCWIVQVPFGVLDIPLGLGRNLSPLTPMPSLRHSFVIPRVRFLVSVSSLPMVGVSERTR
jgi:hypothetical protein